MPLTSRAGRVLSQLMWAALAVDLAWLVLRHGRVVVVVNGSLELLTLVLPSVVCWCAVASAGARRLEVRLLAVSSTLFTCGGLTFIVTAVARGDHAQVFPSPADLFYLPTYVVLLAAVAAAVRRRLQRVNAAVLLDGLIGGLGAAAVLSVLLARVFMAASGGALRTAALLAYPVMDMLLVSAVVGVVALTGLPRRWLPLLLGLCVFAAADIVYALRLADGSYVAGTPSDALWATGLALMARWATRPDDEDEPYRRQGAAALTVPALATAAGLAVLVWAAGHDESALAVTLAALTVVVTAGRTQLAFVHLRRLADLQRQAATDELTGLANRRAFTAYVGAHLGRDGASGALLLLDLDQFKEVNDSFGHAVGDQLLRQVGARLRAHLRSGDVLARLGGDEFAVLLHDVDGDGARTVADTLGGALLTPFLLEGRALRTGVSIGIALAPEHGGDLGVLLRRADIAMYRAKRSGQGCCTYRLDDDAERDARLRTLEELRAALTGGQLTGGQLTLHYQPKLDLRTGEVRGVEALVRWLHPQRGLLHPGSFLALAEDADLMGPLTDLVLDQALDQAARWRASGRPLTVAVNLSASSLVDVALPERIAGQLLARGLPPGALQLEITEDFVMADRDRARGILTALRERGIQIAVDDFGTGYSSLAYLRDLPIDELKLDRSFISPMAADTRAAALVFSTIALAHSLGLRMVAEGVEDQTSLDQLTLHGCDQAQGYHVSRPLTAPVLEHWLDTHTAAAVGSGGRVRRCR